MRHAPNMAATKNHGYAPLPDNLRKRLAAEVRRDGEEPTRKRYGLARDSFARALGGLTIARGTVAIIKEQMRAGSEDS